MAIGGSGGSGQTGGAVVVTNNRFIDTFGIGSHGIFAQSIGGGGGTGGDARSMILSIDPSNWGPEQPELPDPMSISVGATLSVGGSGGTAADGGAVNIYNHQRIVTRGADAYGILAQSIGGGGGIGGGGYHGLDWKDFGVSEETEQYLELPHRKRRRPAHHGGRLGRCQRQRQAGQCREYGQHHDERCRLDRHRRPKHRRRRRAGRYGSRR
jgi:hypothetical protein